MKNSDRPENLLVTGNRWGKSFASAIKIIHHAFFRIRNPRYDSSGKYHIVTASITQDQARIIFDTVLRILHSTCRLEGLIKETLMTPYPKITLGNGAVIEARSTQRRGQYLLGHDYDFFLFDEVAFEPEADFVVNEVVKMRLADRRGILDLVSTPNGRNWFYRKMLELKDKPELGYVQNGDSRENKFISSDYLGLQIQHLSERRVAQNIMGQFVDSGGELIPGKYVDMALIESPIIPFPSATEFASPLYLTGWDLARKKTATVGITVALEGDLARVMQVTRIRQWDWNIILEEIRKQQALFPGRLIIDATGLGDVVVSQLGELSPEAVIFTPKSKAELLTNLELYHNLGKIKYRRWEIPDIGGKVWSLEDEVRSARWDDNNQCDAVMAMALALWPLRRKAAPLLTPKISTF